jgi:four helix bundle protein
LTLRKASPARRKEASKGRRVACFCPGGTKKKNIERPTLNFEWEKMKKQTYDLEERLLEYSVRIIKIVEQLPNTRAGNHVASQLLRSGTSPYPNHGEAQAAESTKGFIHKLRISLKELRETQRWLKLIQRVALITKYEPLNDILQRRQGTNWRYRGGSRIKE